MNKVASTVRAIIKACSRPKKPPRELEFVRYTVGDRMLKSNTGWRLAPEEDQNHVVGWVWIERDAPDPSLTMTGTR